MKAPKFIIPTIVAIALLCFPFVSTGTAEQSPTVRVQIGYTKIEFNASFIEKLTEAGARVDNIRPGFLNLRRRTAIFPIVGGAVDLDNYMIELFHKGGLEIESEDGLNSQLFNFIISTTVEAGGGPFSFPGFMPPMFPNQNIGQMTRLTVIDGIIEYREPLFTLSFPEEMNKRKYNTLIIKDIEVKLDNIQAANLNLLLVGPNEDLFNLQYGETFDVGTATMFIRYSKDRRR